MNIKAIIIDDDINVRESISLNLNTYCKNIEIVAQAENVSNGINVIQKYQPDIVFLDINLPDGKGFDLLRNLIEINFKLIFITAYEEYAIEAFKFSAIDYLLKPLVVEDLVNATEKAEKIISNELISKKIGSFLSHMENNTNKKNKIVLKTIDQIHFVEISSIIRCEADKNYTTFYLDDGRKILVSRTIKEYDTLLTSYNFYRVHQSHLVNLNYVQCYKKNKERKKASEERTIEGDGYLIMKDEATIPVARRKKDQLIKLLGDF